MTKVFGDGLARVERGPRLADRAGGHGRARARRRPTSSASRSTAATAATASATRTRRTRGPTPLPGRGGRLHGLQGALRREVRQPGDQQRQRRRVNDDGRPADHRSVQPARLPRLRRDVREEHARLRRADAGGRRPGHVRLHLRRARRPRRLAGKIHTPTARARPATSQQLKDYDKAFGNFFTRMQERRDHEGQLALRRHRRGGRPLRRHRARTTRRATASRTACTYANGHVTEVNGDLKRLVATYNASHGTTATTDFSVHSDLAPNVYITGNPARDSATPRDLEKAMSDMHGDEPATRASSRTCSSRWPIRSRRSCSTWSRPTRRGRRRSRRSRRATTSSTRRRRRRARTTTSRTACSCRPRRSRTRTRRSRGTTAASSRRSATTWIGWVGPGIEKKGQTDKVWTDHTDIRPTMLSLLGLKDDYVSDGRVVTEFLKGDATPKSLNGSRRSRISARCTSRSTRRSAQFSMDTLCASTGALASNTAGDTTYANTETALAVTRQPARRARERDPRRALERRVQRPEDRREAGEGLDQAGRGLPRPGRRALRRSSRRARTRRSSTRSSTSS